jgi:predicted dehydrogenase
MHGSAVLRIGLIGAGWAAGYHLAAWRSLRSRAEVVAIADPDRAAARSRADEYGIERTYDSAKALLDDVAIDAVDIAAPREFHAPIARLAADRGIAILCQKPLAPTLEEAERLVADIGDKARLMVHENWRFRPHYRLIANWLEQDRVGDVRTVRMSVLTSGLLPDSSGQLPALVRQPMLAGLERMLLMEVLIHHVDTLRFLLGPIDLLGACLGRTCAAIRGEDRAALLMTVHGADGSTPATTSGMAATGAAGAAVTLVGDFMAVGEPATLFDHLEIFGTRGTITLIGDMLRSAGGTDEEVRLDLDANYRASWKGAIAHFIDRLADGQPFETRPQDNLETLRIVEQAYLTGRSGP